MYSLYDCRDETQLLGGNWQAANSSVSRQLYRSVREPRQLLLYVGQVVQMTFNNSQIRPNTPTFSQGQLVVITELADTTLPLNIQRISVRVLPPGCREIQVDNIPNEWICTKIARRFTEPSLIGCSMTKARREQWPFTYYACSTVHKAIGQTCSKLATQISSKDAMFSLWDRRQLLVILSRVRNFNDLLFVGSPQDTVKAMRELLSTTDKWDVFTDRVIESCDTIRHGSGIVPNTNALPSISTTVPSANCGFVFMLISLSHPEISQYGECISLRSILRDWNDILHDPSKFHFRPYALAAFVCGFPGIGSDRINLQHRQEFFESVNDTVHVHYRSKKKQPNFESDNRRFQIFQGK